MALLKCVGGPRDGDIVRLDGSQNSISLIDPDKKSCSLSLNSDLVSSTTYSTTIYSVRCLAGPDGSKLEFLTPENWTDMKAIEHQFQK